VKTIAFFNNKGGVGKTTLLYHLAWMYADLGLRIVAVDLDPQSNLSSMFLDADRLDEIWNGHEDTESITAALRPLIEGTGDIDDPHIEKISRNLALVVGNLALAKVEDEFSAQWPLCLEGKDRAFRVISGLDRVVRAAASAFDADIALLDVGPNLGAINRSAVIAADFVAVPLVPDLFSLQGLRNLGPTLRSWRKGWKNRLEQAQEYNLRLPILPSGEMQPVGYIVMQHAVRASRPTKSYEIWMRRIPSEYRAAVLGKTSSSDIPDPDPNCLAILKHYRSLMPMAMEARKPIFRLTPADGAIGAHGAAVRDCYDDFKLLAQTLAHSCEIELPN
jgi:chromosome partitioning protein